MTNAFEYHWWTSFVFTKYDIYFVRKTSRKFRKQIDDVSVVVA